MSETDDELRRELTLLLTELGNEQIRGLAVAILCECGQGSILTGKGEFGAMRAFLAEEPMQGRVPMLPAEEDAACPNCGALLFPYWNVEVGIQRAHLAGAVEDAIQEFDASGRLLEAVEEFRAQVWGYRERQIRAN